MWKKFCAGSKVFSISAQSSANWRQWSSWYLAFHGFGGVFQPRSKQEICASMRGLNHNFKTCLNSCSLRQWKEVGHKTRFISHDFLNFFISIVIIRLGDKNLNDRRDDNNVITKSILKSYIHPNWNSLLLYYDAGIWEVSPITFGQFIRPICLPTFPSNQRDKYSNHFVYLTGESNELDSLCIL